jgi:hypothetical protein
MLMALSEHEIDRPLISHAHVPVSMMMILPPHRETILCKDVSPEPFASERELTHVEIGCVAHD